MTPHTPAEHPEAEHPELEQLADLAEELTAPAEAEALHAHLRTCAECADSYAALLEVRELLGSTPAPPLPTQVADRIDAALAAESAARQELTPRAAAPGNSPQRPVTARTDTTRPPGRPRRRRRLLAASLGLAAVLGLGTLLSQLDFRSEPGGHASSSALSASAREPVFTDGTLAQQIHGLLKSDSRVSSHALQPEGSTTPDTIGSPSPAAAAPAETCWAGVTGHPAGTAPLTSSPGSYQGRTVQAVVYALPGQPDQLDVYLLTPGCPGATVLLHRTVPTS